jgi:hypothetical protein
MNPIFHEVSRLEMYPMSSSRAPLPGQFHLRLQYRPGRDAHNLLGVHVPAELESALASGEVVGLHIETLEVNSAASRLLPRAPSYLVLGLRCRNGEELRHVPAVLKNTRRRWSIAAIVSCVAGASLFIVLPSYAWAGALLLLAGTHLLRTARAIPIRPFFVYSTHR